MKNALLTWVLFFVLSSLQAQNYSLYSNEQIILDSKHLQETITVNLHLPETQPYSAPSTSYPITVIFDSQHERTYPLIISSIDLLTSETQMPESIILGIPFNFQNRRYFTSSQKKINDTLSGIERMELFLFEELLPMIKTQYKGNDYLTLVGHSRTGFLVNYLAFQRPNQVNNAISLSGFFDDKPLTIDTFSGLLTDGSKFPHRFNYYFTAGTTLEESTYLTEMKSLDSLLKTRSIPDHIKIDLQETPNANHISNYWVSLPSILMDAFSPYNSILDRWFHEEGKAENAKQPIQEFKLDLAKAGAEVGLGLNPSVTHIFSLASQFAGDQDYKTAMDFFEMGLDFYPDYLDFHIELISYAQEIGDQEKLARYKAELMEKTQGSTRLSEAEKEEIYKYLNGDRD
ncbi:alpha/beta hydrolase-fold protein [Algoriphagus sp. oki45]|uniref:alpha/beta hydrolase-fold protein n=1 Tax=Algoriphagus sp. oki45 TaxID=3067294 RepID=UPI0030C69CB5